jgi:hypothetical protein
MQGVVSKYTYSITLNVVSLHSSTQTVSRAGTRGHHVVPLHALTPQFNIVHSFIVCGCLVCGHLGALI